MNITIKVNGKPSSSSEDLAFGQAIQAVDKDNKERAVRPGELTFSGVILDDKSYNFAEGVTYYHFSTLDKWRVWK